MLDFPQLPAMLLTILALMLLDTMTTRICLATGRLREGNPVMKRIASDPIRSMTVKILAASGIIINCYYFRELPIVPTVIISLTIILYSGVVVNNVTRYLKVRLRLGRHRE
ncbi:MAG: hypothetical protein A4E28_00023 [Methanocella sp. PtaU1.Bin125]|nr:MAG: hypothetical protein A4E28_00023 [Methanocella sp. PtaU1.Bin125]